MSLSVTDALQRRLSVRDFLPEPVPGDLIRRVLATAARSPSGGNVQPWYIDVLAGEPMARFKALIQDKLKAQAAGAAPEPLEYDIYPANLWAPHRDYRFELGEMMYERLGIPREDKPARLRWIARNYAFFGAPMGLFCTVDRRMGKPQWSDLGMYLQSVMLLLQEEGIDSCPQEIWSNFPQTVGGFIQIPAERMLFTGMAIGYRNPDNPVNALASKRAPLEAFARFHGV